MSLSIILLFSDRKSETYRQVRYTIAQTKLHERSEPITETRKDQWKENTLLDRKETFYSNQHSLITVKTKDMVDKVIHKNETIKLRRLTMKQR